MDRQSVHWSELRLVLAFQEDSSGVVCPRVVKATAAGAGSMSGDADERDLSIREVNEVIAASGLDAAEVREFAWQLVMQELEDKLPTALTPREIELGERLRKLINRFDDGKPTTRVTLSGILQGIASELDTKRHQAKREKAEANGG